MKKFLISYTTSLLTFIIGCPLILSIFTPGHWTDLFEFIILLIIYGSIPALVACLIGEVLYRKIKQCREFYFGIPIFIGLAVIYTLIPSLFTRSFLFLNFVDFVSFVTPVIIGSLAFYLVRRKI
ncbi:TPA: hypothetical protein ROX87_005360 [Bacillus thuringiensis]|uniref:hypothetical protein n=1 Tax=Bacillus thuringiensis TaxID=1428 RepID=UPI000BF8B823|nr:hypothetical protein [Bacillus thuringiensis]PER45757.1 hypothetical protein CN472_17630 [Bacillus thuringiensis]PFI45861.1 hypothetical protein COI76_29435 [Bacillus cereus]HDX9535849.1 hypothetical protein [Bacillus thuringiensis]